MTHQIRVVLEILSDRSKVYNVRIGGLILPAVTEAEADLLAETIAAAINAHSTDEAVNKYVWLDR